MGQLKYYTGTIWQSPTQVAESFSTNAENSAISASSSATTATNKAAEALFSANAAASSALAAEASFTSFEDRYLGSKTGNPSLDNNGQPLIIGALYWNSVSSEMRVYNGTSWIAAYLPSSTYVTGPASSNTDEIVLFADVTGKVIKTSGVMLASKANSGANSDITSLTGITGGISTADYLQLDTAGSTSAVGRLNWNSGESTVEIGLNADVTLQVGQESIVLCYNGTGSSIPNGSVVYITGAQGQRPTIALADADTEASSSKTLGVATQTIANGAEGFVTTQGIVRGLNTSGFAQGTSLWLSSTAGSLTSTKPVPPAHSVFVGYCVNSHVSSGTVFVNVQNGYKLDELHDIKLTSLANNDLLKYNSTTQLWENIPGSTYATSGHTHTYEPTITAGTTAQYWRGDKTWQTLPTGGDTSTNTNTSVDSEVVLFSGTDGKTLKRATGSGIAKLASGVLSTAVEGTDYQVPITATGLLKGSGAGTVVAAVADTDYVSPSALSSYLPLAGGTLTGGLKESKNDLAANDVNLNLGNLFTKTISTATVFTVSNVPASGSVASFILDLINGGSATITWWSSITWAGGTAPTLTAAGRDVLGFFTHDGGTTWTGLVLGKDMK